MQLYEIHVFTGNEKPTTDSPIQAQLSIPAFSDEEGTSSRVSFVVYRKATLFQSRTLNELNLNTENVNRVVNSQIIAATKEGNVTGPVHTSYVPVETTENMVKYHYHH